MNYRISVITPSFNSAKYIEKAIDSVLEQDYPNFEHIIVDAVSTDGTIDILKKYSHLKLVSEPDKGQSDAMNKGFRMSTGQIIVYLNVDDYLLPGAFKTVVPYFERGAKFVVGNVKIMKSDGTSRINTPRVRHADILRHWELDAFCYNPVGYYYLREVQESVGGYNVDNQFGMDLEFLLAASKKYEFTKIDALLGVFNYHIDTKTSKAQRQINFWTVKNLAFVDRFLKDMPEEFARQYIKDRTKAYRRMAVDTALRNYKLAQKENKALARLYWIFLNKALRKVWGLK